MPDGERYQNWQRIQEGLARVVLGTRSAIFAPVKRLGLIILDEEHETTYKQEETPLSCPGSSTGQSQAGRPP